MEALASMKEGEEVEGEVEREVDTEETALLKQFGIGEEMEGTEMVVYMVSWASSIITTIINLSPSKFWQLERWSLPGILGELTSVLAQQELVYIPGGKYTIIDN